MTGDPADGLPAAGARVLYVIACAAPPAADVAELVRLAQRRGWDTCVLTTPSARRFTDVAALGRQTGHPVRSEYKNPGQPDVLPDPDAVIVAPATVNTINKWAAGICDTLALGILVEAIGKRLPIVALPSTNQAHAAHPAFTENVGKLRSWGVSVLFGAGVHALPEAGPAAVTWPPSPGPPPWTPSTRSSRPPPGGERPRARPGGAVPAGQAAGHLPPLDSRHIVWTLSAARDGEDHVVLHGDVRVSDTDPAAATSWDPGPAAGGPSGIPVPGPGQARAAWARLRRRVLLALATITVTGAAIVSLVVALVLFHGGWLGIALVVLLALGALGAAAVAGLAWMARRMWRRGAWLEALPLLAGQPWLSRAVWAARLLWTGHSLWRLRARVRPAPRPWYSSRTL